jgi:hypothetical protein
MEEKDDFWANVESEQDKSIPSMMISDNQASEPVMITGTPQQLSGNQHQMIMMQQPSSAPNAIGICVIIFGGIILLLTLGGSLIIELLPESSQVDVSYEWYDYIILIVTLSLGAGFIYSGMKITNRQKSGVRLTWLLLLLWTVSNIVGTLLEPVPDPGNGQEVNLPVLYGAVIGFQLFCGVICGLMAAIPLMVNNAFMEPVIQNKTDEIDWSNEVLKNE